MRFLCILVDFRLCGDFERLKILFLYSYRHYTLEKYSKIVNRLKSTAAFMIFFASTKSFYRRLIFFFIKICIICISHPQSIYIYHPGASRTGRACVELVTKTYSSSLKAQSIFKAAERGAMNNKRQDY
jgi:hypothetical protein